MTIDIAVLEAMVAAGTTPDAMLAVVKTQVAADNRRRRKETTRKQKYRASLGQRGTTRDNAGQDTAESREQNAQPQAVVCEGPESIGDKNLHSLSSSSSSEDLFGSKRTVDTRARERIFRAEFAVWYQPYPHKVDKPAALRAFLKARRKGIALETMIAGLERYRKSKPEGVAWCNPATWLNGERWTDEPAPPTARAPPKHAPTNGAAAVVSKLQRNNGHVQQNTDDYSTIEIDPNGSPHFDRAAAS